MGRCMLVYVQEELRLYCFCKAEAVEIHSSLASYGGEKRKEKVSGDTPDPGRRDFVPSALPYYSISMDKGLN